MVCAKVWSRFLSAFEGDSRRAGLVVSLLTRLLAAELCALIVATWPLWSSQSSFPRVPLIGCFANIPTWIEWGALAGVGVAAGVAMLFGTRRPATRWTAPMCAAAIGVLVLANQHRLQPWAYQFVVLEVVLSGLSAIEAIAVARMFIASIYFFSAISKLDRSFLDSGGGQVVDGLLQCLGLVGSIGADYRMLFAGVLAAFELLVAVGLCFRFSRRFAWPAAIAIHVALLAALGPWGVRSKPGVLLWNAYFIAQNLILFGLAGELPANESGAGAPDALATSHRTGRRRWAVRGVAAFAILFPLTEPAGICDAWPAWAVYATSSERLRLFIEPADRNRLPVGVEVYVQSPRFEDGRCLVRIDRWSLDACGAPIYPQNRFRLGVALAIAERTGLDDSVLVEIDSEADRLTGLRNRRQLRGRSAIAAEIEQYWLNGFPREAARRVD